MKNLLFIMMLTAALSAAQTRNQSTMKIKKAGIDTAAMKKAYIGGTLGTMAQADSELTVQHGGHIRGGLKVDGTISGIVAPSNPFAWSVTGSAAVHDSLRFVSGGGILQAGSGNTVTTELDTAAPVRFGSLLLKGKNCSSSLVVTDGDVNANTCTAVQSSDTAAAELTFTGTGKPLLNLTGPTGNSVFVIDSVGRVGVGVRPMNTLHSQTISASGTWYNDVYGNNFPIPIFMGRQIGGSPLSPSTTLNNNTLARFSGAGYTGSTISGSKGIVEIVANENWNDNSNGTIIRFWTTKNGSTSISERMRIDDAGNVGVGNNSPKVSLDISKGLAIRDSSCSTLTTNQNDFSIGTVSCLRLASDAQRTITGFVNGFQGRLLHIFNVGGFNIVIANQSSLSSSINRIITGSGVDITVGPDQTIILWYDSTTQRWRKI